MEAIRNRLKGEFSEAIENNLNTSNQLTKQDLIPYRKILLDKSKNLKFYKYTSAEYYSIRNIETGSIALKNCSEFNDVFEGVPSFNSNEELQKSDLIRKSAVITCFCERENDLLMFAHYANSYTGMCIEYDFSLLSENQRHLLNYFFPVLYVDSPRKLEQIQKLSKDIEEHVKAIEEGKLSLKKLYDIVSFFIHKPSTWSYENEWRLVIPIEQYLNVFGENYKPNKKVYILKDFDCISKIYLGKNIEPMKREHIIEIVKRKNVGERNIEVFDAFLDGNKYIINPIKIDLV